ncbi:SOS response-associated peptidase [Breoghania sp.]|uniref:SOS response-associated peptidase n=1 Tax=Breoghania sp. TaxID=2065378 RepID=UPI002AA8FF7E|nr:SOS response-associated peptidase [Breoghania sp.]
MCGRYSLTASPEEVRALFGYEEQPNFPPRYNIAPTQPIAIVRKELGASHFALARWGLMPGWVKDPASFSLLINARAETAAEKPAFRGSMRHHRCLVPATGFYEWRKMGDGPKQPYWIAPREGGIVAFAGLWSDWSGADGSQVDTAAILTTAANATLKPIHHRMPAVIAPADFERWLDCANGEPRHVQDLLKPPPDDLFHAVPVSTRVNAVRNDDPGIQQEVENPATMAPAPKPARKKKPKDDDGQLDLL